MHTVLYRKKVNTFQKRVMAILTTFVRALIMYISRQQTATHTDTVNGASHHESEPWRVWA